MPLYSPAHFVFLVINTGKKYHLSSLCIYFSLYFSFSSHLFALLAAAFRPYTGKNNASEPGSIASQANSSVTWTQKQGEKIEKSHKQRTSSHSNCTAACVFAHLTPNTLSLSLSLSARFLVSSRSLCFFFPLLLSSGHIDSLTRPCSPPASCAAQLTTSAVAPAPPGVSSLLLPSLSCPGAALRNRQRAPTCPVTRHLSAKESHNREPVPTRYLKLSDYATLPGCHLAVAPKATL